MSPCGTESHLNILIERYPALACVRDDVMAAYLMLERTYASGHKLMIAGNGGSASDSEHIAGELMKSFLIPDHPDESFCTDLVDIDRDLGMELASGLQHALPTIALDGLPSLSTAFINDCNPLMVFAQQVYGLGRRNDALLAISTSGNSKNILYAAVVAKAKGCSVIGLTGERASRLSALADVCVKVPHAETFKIQELHLPVYHCLCAMLEERFFGDRNDAAD